MGAGNDPEFAAFLKSRALGVDQGAYALPLQELGRDRMALPDRILDLVLSLPVRMGMPAGALIARSPVEHDDVIENEARSEELAKKLHHLRMGAGDIEDKCVVGGGEMLGHEPLRIETAGYQRGLGAEEPVVVHVDAQLVRDEQAQFFAAAALFPEFRGECLRRQWFQAPRRVVDGGPVGIHDHPVAHRLQPVQARRPALAPGVGQDALPDPVAVALEGRAIEFCQYFGPQQVVQARGRNILFLIWYFHCALPAGVLIGKALPSSSQLSPDLPAPRPWIACCHFFSCRHLCRRRPSGRTAPSNNHPACRDRSRTRSRISAASARLQRKRSSRVRTAIAHHFDSDQSVYF